MDRARDRRRQKRGGGRSRVRIDLDAVVHDPPDEDLLAVDEALQSLAREDPARAELVSLSPSRLRAPHARRCGRSHGHRSTHSRPPLGLCPRLALRRPERQRTHHADSEREK